MRGFQAAKLNAQRCGVVMKEGKSERKSDLVIVRIRKSVLESALLREAC